MDGINYFQFTDVIEKETVRVQKDEPCAPNYIDSAWLSPDYIKQIEAEMNEECNDDCHNEADVDACQAKCSQVSRSGGGVRSLLKLLFLNPSHFSAYLASKNEVHGNRRAHLSLACASGVSVTWLSVPVVVRVVTWPVATISWKLASGNLCRVCAATTNVPRRPGARSAGVARISNSRIPIWTNARDPAHSADLTRDLFDHDSTNVRTHWSHCLDCTYSICSDAAQLSLFPKTRTTISRNYSIRIVILFCYNFAHNFNKTNIYAVRFKSVFEINTFEKTKTEYRFSVFLWRHCYVVICWKGFKSYLYKSSHEIPVALLLLWFFNSFLQNGRVMII